MGHVTRTTPLGDSLSSQDQYLIWHLQTTVNTIFSRSRDVKEDLKRKNRG